MEYKRQQRFKSILSKVCDKKYETASKVEKI